MSKFFSEIKAAPSRHRKSMHWKEQDLSLVAALRRRNRSEACWMHSGSLSTKSTWAGVDASNFKMFVPGPHPNSKTLELGFKEMRIKMDLA